MSDETSTAIVIDNGSGFTKCGISGGNKIINFIYL